MLAYFFPHPTAIYPHQELPDRRQSLDLDLQRLSSNYCIVPKMNRDLCIVRLDCLCNLVLLLQLVEDFRDDCL
jgi:hypothetical protein